MAKQTINIGTSANDGTGSTLRAAFDICNDNFTELYDGTGGLLHKIEGTNFTGSLLVGHSTTGTLSSALDNTAVGINALSSITSGDYNTVVGKAAGGAITNAVQNTIIGATAGDALTSGSRNVAIGAFALSAEDGHGHNVAVGASALSVQNAGADAYNVAVGSQAGLSVTTGLENTIIGGKALDALTTGHLNVAVGYESLSTEDTGSRNTAVGWRSLKDLNYDGLGYNAAFGMSAGENISTGVQNTVIGSLAADSLTTGSNNIVLGYNAEASAVDVSNEVTIGNSSVTNVRIPSDSTLKIGASGDLQLEHVSSNSFIKNTAVGDLYIENQVDDGSIIFRCDDGSGGLDTYFSIVGAGNRVQYNKDLRLIDGVDLSLGSSDDFNLKHDGSNSKLENYTGDLNIIQEAADRDIAFFNDNGSGGTIEYFRVDGSSLVTIFSKAIKLMDSVRLNMGDQNDLHIRHNGTNGFMTNSTGDLTITNEADDKDIIFKCDDGSGGVEEYFRLDGSVGGSDPVTRFPDLSQLQFGTGGDSGMRFDGSKFEVTNSTGNFEIINYADDKDIIFKSDDGSGSVTEYLRLDGSNPTVVFSKSSIHTDNIKAYFGTGLDLEIFHNATHSFITNANGDLTIANYSDDRSIYFQNDDGSGGSTNYLQIDGANEVNKFYKHAQFLDSTEAKFGNGGDLRIYHDGTNSRIYNETGDLYIRNNADDKDIYFQSDNGSGGIMTYFSLDGSDERINVNATNGMQFMDNVKGKFGTSGDMELYHDGSHSYVKQGGTGDLYIQQFRDDGDIVFQSDDGSGGMATYFFLDGSSVTTQFYKTIKLYDAAFLYIGDSNDLQFYHNGTSNIDNYTGNLDIIQRHNDGDIRFYNDDGSGGTTEYFRVDGGAEANIFSKKVGIGTSSPEQILHVESVSDQYIAKFSHSTATGYAPGSILLEAGQGDSRGQGMFHYNNVADDSWFTGVPYNVASTKWIVSHKADTTFNPDVAQLSHAILTIDSATDNVGIGTSSPASRLEVDGGDIEVDDSGSGLILKSPDGTRFRITVDNSGNLSTASL